MAVNSVKEIAICQVIKNGTVLLIKSEDGINKGKWNAPGGEISQGEQPSKAAMRTVFQETGLYVNKVMFHGNVRLFLNGKNEFSYKLHLFSTKFFTGDLKPNMTGEAKWYNTADIPYYEMWADDKYWVNLVLQGKEFDADFFFDEKNEKIIKYQIREKQKVLQKALPVIIIVAVIAVLAVGIFSLGLFKTSAAKTTTVKPPTKLEPSGNTTTVATTTIAAPNTTTTVASTTTAPTTTTTVVPLLPPKVTIDNIDLLYNYSGPSMQNGVGCKYQSHVQLINYHRVINTTKVYMNLTWNSNNCNLTITRVFSTTPGLTIATSEPTMPVIMPANSTVYEEFIVTLAPNTTYVGPMAITVNDQ